MRERLRWITLGGLCFWLHSLVSVLLIFQGNVGVWSLRVLIILPLAGIASLCAASWMRTKNEPEWGSILAGVYIFGPVAVLATVVVSYLRSSQHVPGEITSRALFYLFPATPSLLIATLVLLAMCLRPKRVFP